MKGGRVKLISIHWETRRETNQGTVSAEFTVSHVQSAVCVIHKRMKATGARENDARLLQNESNSHRRGTRVECKTSSNHKDETDRRRADSVIE